jgi:hypothetical protein
VCGIVISRGWWRPTVMVLALAQMQRISPLAPTGGRGDGNPTAGLWIGAVLLQCKSKAPVNHIAGGTRQTGLYSEASRWRHFFFESPQSAKPSSIATSGLASPLNQLADDSVFFCKPLVPGRHFLFFLPHCQSPTCIGFTHCISYVGFGRFLLSSPLRYPLLSPQEPCLSRCSCLLT